MDEWKRTRAGLFQLHRDGAPTPITSYVDRGLLRSAQLDQFGNTIDWLPEQVIAAVFEQVMEDRYAAPVEIKPVTSGRVFAPTPVKLPVLLAAGEAEGGHALRPYLWPVLDPSGNLALEQGEKLIDRWWVEAPGSMDYASDCHSHLTTHRIATIGKLSLPIDQRRDYKLSLGLISPTMMEGFAVIKQIGRIGQNKGRKWVQHVRYEWLTNVAKLTTTKSKKKLFGGRGAEHVSTRYAGEIRWPNGKSGYIDLGHFSDERLESLRDADELARKTAEFEKRLEHAIQGHGLRWDQTTSTVREIVGGTQAMDVYTLDDDAGYTVPGTLAGL
jgi:hypothetical protein